MIKPSVKSRRPTLLLLASGTLALVPSGLEAGAAALDWSPGPGCRSAVLPILSSGRAGFTLLPPAVTGIAFTNFLSDARTAENQLRLNGSGVACGDVDGDGACDVYFCGLENGNRLYRNLGGWKFEDITETAGVACADQFSTGAVFADVDGDGRLDLLVSSLGTGTRLLLNDGKGRFREEAGSGLVRKFGATTLALADVNGDGYLDLYVANYRTTTIRTTGLPLLKLGEKISLRPQDRDDYELTPQGLIIERGEPDLLYLNDGKGSFQAVSWTNGVFLNEEGRPLSKAPKDWGLTAAFRDLNGDRAPDLYVCNDFDSPERLWINDGQGRYVASARQALRSTSTFSMAVDFADINRDGLDDLFTADMLDLRHEMRMVEFLEAEVTVLGAAALFSRPQLGRNTVQLSRGDGTYAEAAYYCGLEASGWTSSAAFLDVDLDGYEDLVMSTGYAFDTQDRDALERIEAMGPMGKNLGKKILMHPRLPLPRVAFRNLGNLHFQECGARWGLNDEGVSHGMALADLDNDGDLDILMNSLNEGARVYRNDSSAPRIAVRLKGQAPNTRGIGAKILVHGGAVPVQSQEMMCGGRYLSGDDNVRVFAAGRATNGMTIEVHWRDGRNSAVSNVVANRIYEIDEAGAAIPAAKVTPAPPSPFFKDVSELLAHEHHEAPFDDFQRQPLLPKKLSQLGPGVAWGDLAGDGWDDLLIGSGKGGRLAAYRNNGQGGFAPFGGPNFDQILPRDQTGVLLWPVANTKTRILTGAAIYEERSPSGGQVVALEPVSGTVEDIVGEANSSVGPLVLGDLDGDVNLDLFVGGRVIPGRYPEPASSRVYRGQAGKFVLDPENTQVLAQSGLVSGAVMTDLDGDGFPELVLACEWGPIKVFKNERGHLCDATAEWGLEKYAGWWNGVTAGDLDGDGRMDLIAANWGLNTKYRANPEHPRKLYYGEFHEPGTWDTIEAYWDERTGKEVPEREFDAVAAAMPFLRGIFPTYRAYGAASLTEVLGERRKSAREVGVNTLASMAFLNRSNRFDATALPAAAQLSPAFAAVVNDFDGDGTEDLFLSQNFFATETQTSRSDAGRGLWLKGDGRGGFQAVPGQESGITVYGEQRGAAAADYDGDGRVDLVVTQNATATKLYHNEKAKPGLRVRLSGPPGNPNGIGAIIRIQSGDKFGPARELHAGSGYWSQDSPVQVLARRPEPMQLWVRWPGGKSFTVAVPANATEIQVGIDGVVTQLKPTR